MTASTDKSLSSKTLAKQKRKEASERATAAETTLPDAVDAILHNEGSVDKEKKKKKKKKKQRLAEDGNDQIALEAEVPSGVLLSNEPKVKKSKKRKSTESQATEAEAPAEGDIVAKVHQKKKQKKGKASVVAEVSAQIPMSLPSKSSINAR